MIVWGGELRGWGRSLHHRGSLRVLAPEGGGGGVRCKYRRGEAGEAPAASCPLPSAVPKPGAPVPAGAVTLTLLVEKPEETGRGRAAA